MNFEIFFTLFETALLFINRIRIFNKAHIFQWLFNVKVCMKNWKKINGIFLPGFSYLATK